MKLLYKLATRSRPHKFFAVLDNIQAMALHTDYKIVVSADYDDKTMFNDEVRDRCKEYKNVIIHYGESKNKVDAINRDMCFHSDWDILINMSDDMEFIKVGFDLEIIKDFERYRSLDILVHYPDQKAGFATITMAIMGKYFYQRLGYIYNPIYKSLYCDNEQMEVAKKFSRYIFIKKRLFNHNHPLFGLAPKDELYLHTVSFHKEDKDTFEKRKAEKFI